MPTEPDPRPADTAGAITPEFTGTWVGVRRVVSCNPQGEACAQYAAEGYFAASLNQQRDAVDGSVVLSEPGPLVLPSGFPIRGRISPSGQLSFERHVVDVREPQFSGEVTVRTSSPPELIGRMTGEDFSLGQPVTLLWEIAAVRR